MKNSHSVKIITLSLAALLTLGLAFYGLVIKKKSTSNEAKVNTLVTEAQKHDLADTNSIDAQKTNGQDPSYTPPYYANLSSEQKQRANAFLQQPPQNLTAAQIREHYETRQKEVSKEVSACLAKLESQCTGDRRQIEVCFQNIMQENSSDCRRNRVRIRQQFEAKLKSQKKLEAQKTAKSPASTNNVKRK